MDGCEKGGNSAHSSKGMTTSCLHNNVLVVIHSPSSFTLSYWVILKIMGELKMLTPVSKLPYRLPHALPQENSTLS